jgi:hypothetical protein
VLRPGPAAHRAGLSWHGRSPPVVRGQRGDDCGVREPAVAAGRALCIASSPASSRSSFALLEYPAITSNVWQRSL